MTASWPQLLSGRAVLLLRSRLFLLLHPCCCQRETRGDRSNHTLASLVRRWSQLKFRLNAAFKEWLRKCHLMKRKTGKNLNSLPHNREIERVKETYIQRERQK